MDQERFGAGAVANGGTKDSIITARMRNVRAGKWPHAATKGPRPAPCTLGPTVWNVQDGRSNHILGCCTHLLRVWLRPVRHLMSVRPYCQESHSQSRFYVRTPSDISEQFDIKSWQDLDDPKKVDSLGLLQKLVPEGMQADKHMYKLEPIAAPTAAVSLQIENSVRKTPPKPEDEGGAADVREWNKLVSKVMMSNPVVIFSLVCLEEVVVVTVDALFAKE